MGGNLWRKWLGESDEPGRNRVQAFVYSRLWMGVFPSFLAGFAVIFLICYWGNLPVEKSSNKALLSGLLCVVGYAIGVWAAVAPDKDDEEDESKRRGDAHGDPAGNRSARVLEQIDEKVDDSHGVLSVNM